MLITRPLFYGDIEFTIIVIFGPIKPSANKYSRAKVEIDSQKLFYIKFIIGAISEYDWAACFAATPE